MGFREVAANQKSPQRGLLPLSPPLWHLFPRIQYSCGSDTGRTVELPLHLTLILQLESWPVLGVVAVEVQDGIVGCGEQGTRQFTPAEPAHHAAGLGGAAPDFQEIMVRFRGEVQKLDVSAWERNKSR